MTFDLTGARKEGSNQVWGGLGRCMPTAKSSPGDSAQFDITRRRKYLSAPGGDTVAVVSDSRLPDLRQLFSSVRAFVASSGASRR